MDDAPTPIEVVGLGGDDSPDGDAEGAVVRAAPPTRLVLGVVVVVVVSLTAALLWPSGAAQDGPTAVVVVGGGQRGFVGSGPLDDPTLVWSDEEADGCRQVIAAATIGDIVVVTAFGDSFDADVDSSGFVAVARSSATGEERWRVDLGSGFAEQFVALDDRRLLVVTTTSIRVIDVAAGTAMARRTTSPRSVIAIGPPVVVRRSEALIVLDDRLAERYRIPASGRARIDVFGNDLVVLDGGILTVYDLRDGSVRWVDKGSIDAVAVLADVVAAQTDRSVRGLARADGAPRWETEADEPITAIGDELFAAAPSGRGEIEVFDGDGIPLWKVASDSGFVLGVTGPDPVVAVGGEDAAAIRDGATGSVLVEIPHDVVSGVSVTDVLLADGDGVSVVDLRTGTERFRFDTDGAPCGMTVVDGGVLVATADSLSFYA